MLEALHWHSYLAVDTTLPKQLKITWCREFPPALYPDIEIAILKTTGELSK